MKNKKILINILSTIAMVAGIPLVMYGDTYQLAISMECLAVFFSYIIILRSRVGRKSLVTYATLAMWLFIPLSFLLQLGIFGSGLEGLSNWTKTSLVIGIVAMVLTSVQLFRVNR